MTETSPERRVPSLPTTAADWAAMRKSKKPRSIIDQVEEIHLSLLGNPDYVRLIDATDKGGTVEGGFIDDDVAAAIMIREAAKDAGNPSVADADTATIRRALGIVLNRYNASRKYRRKMANGG